MNLEADDIAVVQKELFAIVSLALARNESVNASSVENQLANVSNNLIHCLALTRSILIDTACDVFSDCVLNKSDEVLK